MYNNHLELAIKASIEAGQGILKVYETAFSVEEKEDKSPLTLADKISHAIIFNHLKATNCPILSEEGRTIPYTERSQWDMFWMVDPLDGTKEFIKRNGEFTVNIALIHDQKPILGVIFVPVENILYFASEETGAYKVNIDPDTDLDLMNLLQLGTRLPEYESTDKYTVVCSRSHLSPETETFVEELKKTHPELDFVSRGSSLKLCLIAEGQADVYPRFAPTMEWDTAAGQAIVECSGRIVKQADSDSSVIYNKENLLNPWFIAGKSKDVKKMLNS